MYVVNLSAVDCGSLPAPDNGQVNVSATTFNSTATYSCDAGYELNGNQSRTCLFSGNWSGNEPSCTGEYRKEVK